MSQAVRGRAGGEAMCDTALRRGEGSGSGFRVQGERQQELG